MAVTIDAWRITGQSQIDSYVGRFAELAVVLVNTFAVTEVQGRPRPVPATPEDRVAALEVAMGEWREVYSPLPPVAGAGAWVDSANADLVADVAGRLRAAFGEGALAGVSELNELLVRHGAVPNLHGLPGQAPVLAFHAEGAGPVAAIAADSGTALAMIIGVGQGERLASCRAAGCALVFVDTTKNASRRFCGLACQNRAKAAAYRARAKKSTL